MFLTEPCRSPTPTSPRPRLIRDASFLEADRCEIALLRGRHNRLGFAYQVGFVRVLGRRKNVILYGEIKIDPAKLKMRDPLRVFQHESGRYPGFKTPTNTEHQLAGIVSSLAADPPPAGPVTIPVTLVVIKNYSLVR